MLRSTAPRGEPRPTKPIADLLAEGGCAQTTCPECGSERAFYTTNSYGTKTLGRRRLRQCRICGHAVSETVPAPVPDGAEGEGESKRGGEWGTHDTRGQA